MLRLRLYVNKFYHKFANYFIIYGRLFTSTESYAIVGVLFEVHKNLGKGFSEIVYKDALEYEFNQLNIPFEREKEFP